MRKLRGATTRPLPLVRYARLQLCRLEFLEVMWRVQQQILLFKRAIDCTGISAAATRPRSGAHHHQNHNHRAMRSSNGLRRTPRYLSFALCFRTAAGQASSLQSFWRIPHIPRPPESTFYVGSPCFAVELHRLTPSRSSGMSLTSSTSRCSNGALCFVEEHYAGLWS